MKSLGIVRRVDGLGRIVIPIELRNAMGIGRDDPLEIFVEGDKVIFSKYHPACVFCGDVREVAHHKGRLICRSCLAELSGR